MIPERLQKQIDFIVEIDKAKQIYRRTVLIDKSRQENDAEHSWHLAIMAFLMKEYAPEGTDIEKVMKMVLVHDLVEIDAGDTYCYDVEANKDKRERELAAADRIFNILPKDQAEEIRALWDEFEECETNEALYAAALDRVQPLIHNYYTDGHTWGNGVNKDMVCARVDKVKEGAPELWQYVDQIISECVEKGILSAE